MFGLFKSRPEYINQKPHSSNCFPVALYNLLVSFGHDISARKYIPAFEKICQTLTDKEAELFGVSRGSWLGTTTNFSLEILNIFLQPFDIAIRKCAIMDAENATYHLNLGYKLLVAHYYIEKEIKCSHIFLIACKDPVLGFECVNFVDNQLISYLTDKELDEKLNFTIDGYMGIMWSIEERKEEK